MNKYSQIREVESKGGPGNVSQNWIWETNIGK